MGKIIPLVGITRGTDAGLPKSSELYKIALQRRGARVTFISPGHNVKEIAARFGGFVIPGGKDLDPSLYGEKVLFRNEREEARRTEFEFTPLDEIMKIGKPVLGICYGMQAINVFLGGSLYQDIKFQIPGKFDHGQGSHPIEFTENPYIQEGTFVVNSSHHQAVKKLCNGAVSVAYAPDGVNEAFYLPGHPFCVGVQWHPERMETALSGLIFERLIRASIASQ